MPELQVPSASHGSLEPARVRDRIWAIFLVSVLILFLELLLIRWIGTEIRIFAYLQNTVLVVCFMGMGLGCFTSRKPFVLRELLLPLFILVLLLAIPFTRRGLGKISDLLSVLSDLVIWDQQVRTNPWRTVLCVCLGLTLTLIVMILIWDIFVPLGRLLGRLMDEHSKTIWAYSANVAGSLVGIWGFVLLSFFYQPPITWFALIGLLLLAFLVVLRGRELIVNACMLLGIVCLAWLAGREPDSVEVWWTGYQKLVVTKVPSQSGKIGKYLINVNNTSYQEIIDLSAEHVSSDPKLYPPELLGWSQYDIPFLFHPNPRSALIVGAGSGNDAAGGLRNGVKHITAVEIDPAIISIGRRFHPEQPYASASVQVVIDDARSFFANCKERFDVISFGLLDAHTATAMTNARLDHYVYTKESFEKVRSLLADGGILIVNFLATQQFIADRIAGVIREVFGEEPMTFFIPTSGYGRGGVLFVAGDLAAVQRQLAEQPQLASQITKWQSEFPVRLSYTTRVATDDWPYLYLEGPRIPLLYFLLAGMLFLLFIRAKLRLKTPVLVGKWTGSHWHFFFLGAAFLLLEVQNISKAAAVLGNTWWVNAVIISGVLIMILLANAVASKWPTLPLGTVYACLCGTCIALYFVDMSWFAVLPYFSKAVVVGGLTCLPMLFSGIAFIRSFVGEPHKDAALGANLIGSLVGGLLQSITFVVGIKALLLIVTALYFCAMLTRPRDVQGHPVNNTA